MGDANHIGGYHCGRDRLRTNDYSNRAGRDRAGLTLASSAIDIGNFGRLREMSVWLVEQCRASAPDCADIREVIYTADGKTVLRWDRERGVTSAPYSGDADDSHLWHTHVSFYRDSEARDKTGPFKRFFEGAPIPPKPGPSHPAFPGRTLRYTPGRSMMSGQDVRTWQARMKARGWRIDVDGEYGPQSAGVARSFQKEKGLAVDGLVGPNTWRASWTAPIT